MPAGQLSLASLPDDVLVAILSRLGPEERHRAVPLVSRRFSRLANAATQQAGTLRLWLSGSGNVTARRTSLCSWVLRHGAGHIRSLDLSAEYTADDAAAAQLPVAIAAMVTACSPQLRGLRLVAAACQPPMWAACLQRLRHLVLSSSEQLFWDLTPGTLPALGTLSLAGRPLVVPPSAHLPPSLSRLYMGGCEDDTVLPKLASLTGLHSLSLKDMPAATDGYAALPPSLRRLAMEDCISLPACLSRLTALEALVVQDDEGYLSLDNSASDTIQMALPRLSQLTLLALGPFFLEGSTPLAALASCANLRSFFWLHAAGGFALPSGPWLASLQRLEVAATIVARSSAALRAATRLEFLAINCCYSYGDKLALALRAVELAPALRHLLLGGTPQLLGDNIQLVVDAQRRCPHLCIECCTHNMDLFPAFLEQAGYEFPTFDTLE